MFFFSLCVCSFRPSCQFLKTICPSLFDPSSIHWTPKHPTPARWASADRPASAAGQDFESANMCDLKSHICCFSIWGRLASLLLRPRFFSCAAFMSCQIYCKFKLPLEGKKKNRQYILDRVSKLETDWKQDHGDQMLPCLTSFALSCVINSAHHFTLQWCTFAIP